jgi:hypothetical protein
LSLCPSVRRGIRLLDAGVAGVDVLLERALESYGFQLCHASELDQLRAQHKLMADAHDMERSEEEWTALQEAFFEATRQGDKNQKMWRSTMREKARLEAAMTALARDQALLLEENDRIGKDHQSTVDEHEERVARLASEHAERDAQLRKEMEHCHAVRQRGRVGRTCEEDMRGGHVGRRERGRGRDTKYGGRDNRVIEEGKGKGWRFERGDLE